MRRYLFTSALCLAALSAAHAQPPEAPKKVVSEVPLLQIPLDEFVAQQGGLTRLKLKMNDATADEIAAEVEKQTGIKLWVKDNLRWGDQTPRFAVEAADQLFWQAIKEWNRGDQNLSVRGDVEHPERWRLVKDSAELKGRAFVAGPCLLTLKSIVQQQIRSLDFNSDPQSPAPYESTDLTLQYSLFIDPKIYPSLIGQMMQVDQVTNAQNLPVEVLGSTTFGPSLGRVQGSIRLYTSGDKAKKLTLLKGVIRLALATKTEHWEIDTKQMPSAEKTFHTADGDVRLRFIGFDEFDGKAQANLRSEREPVPTMRVFRNNGKYQGDMQLTNLNALARSVQFLNAQGEPLQLYGYSKSSGLELDADMKFTFSPSNDKDVEKYTPTKIVIDVPLEWREVDVPFEWKDVPLP